MTQDITREVSRLTINNPDGKEFVFIFTDPFDNTADDHITEKATSGCTANELKEIIKPFYQHSVKTDPVVTLTCYDSGDLELDNCNAITTYSCTNALDNDATVTCESCKDENDVGISCEDEAAAKCVDASTNVVECAPITKSTVDPKYVYDITVPRSIDHDSWSNAEVVPTGTTTKSGL